MRKVTQGVVESGSDVVRPLQETAKPRSFGGSLHTVGGALQAAIQRYWGGAAELVGVVLGDPGFDHVSRAHDFIAQQNFIAALPDLALDVEALSKGDRRILESLASRSADELNEFLRKRGFSISIDPLSSDEVGFASVLDALVKWLNPGTPVEIAVSRIPKDPSDRQRITTYPGVKLKSRDGVQVMNTIQGDYVCIRTQNGDLVHMMIPLNPPKNSYDAVNFARHVMELQAHPMQGYTEVHFPMIDLHYQGDVSWLIGLGICAQEGAMKGNFRISVAKEETRLRVNCEGARAQTAFVGVAMRSFEMPSPFVINRPFLFWIARPSLRRQGSTYVPYFAAWCDTDSWKDPGSLE